MKVARTPEELRLLLDPVRREGRRIGMVPTMGALHRGHLSLIEAAARECDLVVVSIFVNPKQFGPSEDFEAYPRDEGRDFELAEGAGADVIYAPSVESMYPDGFATTVEVSGLTEVLCGAPEHRGPDHFKGVTTVVCKLLNAADPDRAYFGLKDAQQVAVIKRMVRDLDMPVEIRAMPTVREPDGLALSSRNAYLDAEERLLAVQLSRSLRAAERALAEGRALGAALDAARAILAEAGIEPEYLEARDPDSLAPASEVGDRPILIALAARVGPARLIDNIVFDPHAPATAQDGLAIQGGSVQ